MKHTTISIIMLAMLPSIASAQSIETIDKATNLGTMLAAEKVCGLSYDQTAISQWIDDNVASDAMDFSGTLSSMIVFAKYQLSELSPSERTAHCRSIIRTAKHYGFVE